MMRPWTNRHIRREKHGGEGAPNKQRKNSSILAIDITNHQPVVALRYRRVFKLRRVGGDVDSLPTKRCPLSDLHNFTPCSSLSSSSWPTTTTRTIPASLIPLRSSKMSTNSQTSHQWLTCSRLGSRYPWGTLGRNHPTN